MTKFSAPTTQRDLGLRRHRNAADALRRAHQDGTRCDWCGRPMYRDRTRKLGLRPQIHQSHERHTARRPLQNVPRRSHPQGIADTAARSPAARRMQHPARRRRQRPPCSGCTASTEASAEDDGSVTARWTGHGEHRWPETDVHRFRQPCRSIEISRDVAEYLVVLIEFLGRLLRQPDQALPARLVEFNGGLLPPALAW